MTKILRIVLAFAALLFGAQAQAQLSLSQMTTLRTACQVDQTCAALAAAADDTGLAAWFNATPEPSYIVWRTSVPVDDIMRNGMDWARVDNLTNGKARIWDWMGRLGALNCARPNIRAGIDATWVGTAADLAVRSMVYTHCKRPATRAEKALASGTGSDASPAVMTYEGQISPAEASLIRS